MDLEHNINTIKETEIIAFLQETQFFRDLQREQLTELAKQFEMIYIKGGETLIEKGDKGDCLYLVISGRLYAIEKNLEEDNILNEMGSGELIGELAMLTQEPRAVTVVALRDSILLKLSQASFDSFIKKYPQQLPLIVRSSISRILKNKQRKQSSIHTISIGPAADNTMLCTFVQDFVNELSKKGSTLYLNREKVLTFILQQGIGEKLDKIEENSQLVNWLNSQEREYDFIVYETDQDYTEWTKCCFRQADRILLIGYGEGNWTLGNVEKRLYLDSDKIKKPIELILLYREYFHPVNTKEWLKMRKINHHYNIKKNSTVDLQKLIRIITGHGIGLVLGGGGARALAEIGVYKALLELGIPIDLVGGTSFGAMIGCCIANGLSPEVISETIKVNIIDNKNLFHYTIPIHSINSGIALTQSIKKVYGETTEIDDLWTRYFCIVCNLTKAKMEVVQSGLIWRALRATVSLPAIFPPITNEFNELLIDGGIINNLPVDVMRKFAYGGKIIAVSSSFGKALKADIPEGTVSTWHSLYDRYLHRNHKIIPDITQIILKSIGVSSIEHEQTMRQQADYAIEIKIAGVDLFGFKAIERLVEVGYKATMEKFSKESIDDFLNFS